MRLYYHRRRHYHLNTAVVSTLVLLLLSLLLQHIDDDYNACPLFGCHAFMARGGVSRQYHSFRNDNDNGDSRRILGRHDDIGWPFTATPILETRQQQQRISLQQLSAKRGGRRRQGGGRGGRRSKGVVDGDDDDDTDATSGGSVQTITKRKKKQQQQQQQHQETIIRRRVSAPPSSTKRFYVRLDRSTPHPPLDVCVVQVVDAKWWEEESENSNPYGARLWPSSLACAQFLCQYLTTTTTTTTTETETTAEDNTIPPISSSNSGNGGRGLSPPHRQSPPPPPPVVIEIGCGTGLVSIAAAGCGAKALATDIAPVALQLTRDGWKETKLKNAKIKSKKRAGTDENDDWMMKQGSVEATSFDVFSTEPLPLPPPQQQQPNDSSSSSSPPTLPPIVVASAVLYDKFLAKAIAKRVFEACTKGAWVILGDCDTGLREGGQDIFEAELERLSTLSNNKSFQRDISHMNVQQKEFGWTSKAVRLLHYNAPENVVVELKRN